MLARVAAEGPGKRPQRLLARLSTDCAAWSYDVGVWSVGF